MRNVRLNGRVDSSVLLSAAKYRPPTITSTPKKIALNSDGILECRASGGYPEGRIRWFDEKGKEKMEDAQMPATPMDGGLFQLTSRLKLQKRSISSKYNCTVFSASGGLDGEVTCDFTCEATCEVTCEPKLEGTCCFRLLGSVLLLSTTATTLFSCCCSLRYGGCKCVTSHKPLFVGTGVGRKP